MKRQLSIWEHRTLLGHPDIVVIGAGIVGLTAARFLAEHSPNKRIIVLEKDIIGSTASSRNAGFACFGSVSEICDDLQNLPEHAVVDLINMRREGLQQLTKRYGANKLQLNLCGGYEVFRDQGAFDKYATQIDQVNNITDQSDTVFEIRATPSPLQLHRECILNRYEGHLDTGLLYQNLVKDCESYGVSILRGLEVSNIQEQSDLVELELNHSTTITTQQVIVATNALTPKLLPDIKILPARNQVIVTTPIENHGLYGTFHMDEGYIYFRDIGDRVLIGGGRNRFKAEETTSHGLNEENIEYLKTLLQRHILPHISSIEIEYQWSGIIAPGPSKFPIVERYSDRITMGVRLGGMGVAIGMKIGADVATLSMT